ncbi:MAG: hypothetical protein HC888_15985, partial [Candidatus Competibacteraceae bacterium]|nr:hypothetical protein [Candidatus Competibacteraceae bacterium]
MNGNRQIYIKRITQFRDRVLANRYQGSSPLAPNSCGTKDTPIPLASLPKLSFKKIDVGETWAQLWGCGWFRFTGTVPAEFAGREIVALLDIGGEGCVFVNGTPEQGITVKREPDAFIQKRRVHLSSSAKAGEAVEILVEAGANGLFGERDVQRFVLNQSEMRCFNREIWQLGLDLEFLLNLALSLPETSVRGRRILHGLNEAANLWHEGSGLAACRDV